MADIEKLSTEAVEKFVLGLLEPLSIWVQAGQDRKNQKADVEAYRKALTLNPRRALLPDAHPRLAETLLLRPLQWGQVDKCATRSVFLQLSESQRDEWGA